MKLNPILGKGTGKVGGLVFQVNSGVQIIKEKPEHVSNPRTDAQVAQRAKMKLMSQIAAALAPALAFSKQGLKSARNLFIKRNFDLTNYSEGEAGVDFTLLHITDGTLTPPDIVKGSGTTLGVHDGTAGVYDIVRYAFCKIDTNKKIQVLSVQTVEDPTNGVFSINYGNITDVQFVYAFGAKFNSAAAKTIYDNYQAALNGDGAWLDISVAGSLSGTTKTDTKYLDLTGE